VIEDLRTYGAPEEEIERWKRENSQQSEADLVVLPADCREAVLLFLEMGTQWRSTAIGPNLVLLGLDYAGVRAALVMSRRRMTPALFGDLQLMERAAIERR
jgi:hypothetical protein